ncbi:MAG: ammonium transporter [Pseudomonadota bacterium]
MAAGLIALPSMAFAQDGAAPTLADMGYILNTLLMLVAGILVMFMAVGFSMFEAGFVRSKNVAMQLVKNIGLLMTASILFYLVGHRLMRPEGYWLIEGILGGFGTAAIDPVDFDGVAAATSHSNSADFLFQMMFCAATASIVSGAMAERMKLWPFMAFIAVLTAIIYPIQASWSWGGGFLYETFGFYDLAGSTVVHSVGGWAALAGAAVLGPRIGRFRDGLVVPMPASNLTLAALGAFLLWVGWFGFNAGSLGSLDSAEDVANLSRIIVNTNLAAAGGALAAMVFTQVRFGSVDLTLVLNGMLAGLVAVTADPLSPSPIAAALIGAVGGCIVVIAIPLFDRFQIDDVVGAVPVHLFAGIWGTIAVAFSNPDATIGGQLAGVLIVGAFVFGASLFLWSLLAATIGIRVSEDVEEEGLDIAELGLEAYPDFAVVRES